jgi:carboxypeptidase D
MSDMKGNFNGSSWNRYHSELEMAIQLRALTKKYPEQARVFSIGRSAQGRNLQAVELFYDLSKSGTAVVPSVKLVGNMHGNETVGREILLRLCFWICAKYRLGVRQNSQQSSKFLLLLRNVRVFVIPTMNPDGFAARTRCNAMNIDLNRSFPDPFSTQLDVDSIIPETLAIQRWTRSHGRFVLSADLHGGALVVSYGYNNQTGHKSGYSATPDDRVFRWLAKAYAVKHGAMERLGGFQHGITNGSAWKSLPGCMQDWDYTWYNIIGLTLEISLVKDPPESSLPSYWHLNKFPLLEYMLHALHAVRGVILDNKGFPIVGAAVQVKDNDKIVYSMAPFGDFYRMVCPGQEIVLVIEAIGYSTNTFDLVVGNSGLDLGDIILHQLCDELIFLETNRTQNIDHTPKTNHYPFLWFLLILFILSLLWTYLSRNSCSFHSLNFL